MERQEGWVGRWVTGRCCRSDLAARACRSACRPRRRARQRLGLEAHYCPVSHLGGGLPTPCGYRLPPGRRASRAQTIYRDAANPPAATSSCSRSGPKGWECRSDLLQFGLGSSLLTECFACIMVILLGQHKPKTQETQGSKLWICITRLVLIGLVWPSNTLFSVCILLPFRARSDVVNLTVGPSRDSDPAAPASSP